MRNGRVCVRHTGEIEAARGQGCGQAGWGPGHRAPHGWTVTLMDAQVDLIHAACADDIGCGATVDPSKLRCMSIDKCGASATPVDNNQQNYVIHVTTDNPDFLSRVGLAMANVGLDVDNAGQVHNLAFDICDPQPCPHCGKFCATYGDHIVRGWDLSPDLP